MTGSIRKRGDNSWEITLDLGRDGRGKRVRRFVTVKGTKKHAQRRLRELLTELDGGIVPSNQRVRLRDWLDRWMAECVVGHVSQATEDRYRGIVKNHLEPELGHTELNELAPRHVQALQQKLLDQGMDPKGVNLVRTALSGAMKHALRMELIIRNPVAAAKAPPEPNREAESPPVDAVLRMLGLAAQQDHWLHAALHLLAYTGIRRGELLALLWDAVDLEKAEVRIVSSLGRRSNGLQLTKPKTARGNRTVNLDAGTAEVLRRHKERQEHHKSLLAGAYEDSGIVFADEVGRWSNPMRLTRLVKRLGRQVGYPDCSPHKLRHFHASVSLNKRIHPAVVSERLGHANTAITMRVYAHALPGWQAEAADEFARIMEESQKALLEDDNDGHIMAATAD